MNRDEALERVKFLHDQVHQTAERQEHLPERLPLPIHPPSLNYGRDLSRFEGEYNRMVQQGLAEGLFTVSDLEQAGLPHRFDH